MNSMSRPAILFAIFILIGQTLHAQNLKLKGDVRNEANEGVPFAAVVLNHVTDSALVKAATTDLNGVFSLSGISSGQYFLEVSSVGYVPFQSEKIDMTNADKDLGTISMTSSSVDLNAVTIRAERALIEVMPDKTVFNVKNVGGTAGLTGFELLRRSPGVVIDNNNNLILEGKTGVQVWFDGKPSVLSGEDLTQYLRTLQASDIESIEIITQPSAKYDAEGTAGIINIRLKRDKRYGTNGSLSAGWAYWDYHKVNSAFSVNNRNRKTNLFVNYSNRFAKNRNWMAFSQEILDQQYNENSDAVSEENSHALKVGLDYFISSTSTIGIVASGRTNDNGRTNDSFTDILALSSDATPARLEAESIDEALNQNQLINTNYRYEDTLGHSLSVDADFYNYSSKRNSLQPNSYYDPTGTSLLSTVNYRMDTPTNIQLLSGKVDYEQNLWKGKFGIGVKASQVVTDNSFGFFQEDENGVYQFISENSNDFEYSERVLAGYVNYSNKKDKWGYQLGFRLENTYSLGDLQAEQSMANDRVERNYTNLFPSGGVTYQQKRDLSWALNYSRRINRPNYEDLNPFQFRLNELGYVQGNPFLRPNYSDNIKLSNTWKYRYTTSLSYTRVSDFYAQVTDTIADSQTFGGFTPSILQARNVATEQVLSLNFSLPFDVNEWWSVYLNINAFNTSYASEDPRFNPLDLTAVSLYGQNSIKLKKELKLEISGWVNNGSIWGGTFITEPQGSLDLALSNKFFDSQLSVSAAINDIFYTAPWTARGEFNGLPIDGRGGWESRLVRINLTYNFGNQELKRLRERKTATEEERKRI